MTVYFNNSHSKKSKKKNKKTQIKINKIIMLLQIKIILVVIIIILHLIKRKTQNIRNKTIQFKILQKIIKLLKCKKIGSVKNILVTNQKVLIYIKIT